MKDLEKNLKNRFKSQFIPVDKKESEDLWVGISKGLNTPASTWYSNLTFTKFFLMIGACAIFTISIYFAARFNSDTNSKIQSETNIQTEQLLDSKNTLTPISENKKEENSDLEIDSSKEIKNINPLVTTDSKAGINKKSKPKTISKISEKSNDSKGVGIHTTNYSSSIRAHLPIQSNTKSNDATVSIIENNKSSFDDGIISKKTVGKIFKDHAHDNPTKNITYSFELLTPLSINLLNLSEVENLQDLSKDPKRVDKKKSSRWNAEIFGGANFMNFDFHSSDNSDIATLKNQTEKNYVGQQFGINLAYNLNPQTILQTGISYENFWSKLDHTFTNQELIEKKDQLIKVWIDANSLDTLSRQIVDTVTTLTTTNKVIHFNKYEKLSIPLMLGFQKEMRKFSFILFVGPTFNFYTNQEGKQIDLEGKLIDFSKDDEPIFNKFQLGLSSKVGVYYHWRKSLDLFIAPQVNFESTKLLDDSIGLRTYQFQANVGLRYRW